MAGDELVLYPNEEEVAVEVLQGEAVLINLRTGHYYSMDKVGADVWQMIERRQRLGTIAASENSRSARVAGRKEWRPLVPLVAVTMCPCACSCSIHSSADPTPEASKSTRWAEIVSSQRFMPSHRSRTKGIGSS